MEEGRRMQSGPRSFEQVWELVAELETMVGEVLMTVSAARVHRYTHGSERERAGPPESLAGPPSHSSRVSEEEGSTDMKIEGEGKRVTVYVGSADTWGGT